MNEEREKLKATLKEAIDRIEEELRAMQEGNAPARIEYMPETRRCVNCVE